MTSKTLQPPAQSINGFFNQTLPELSPLDWVFRECLLNQPNNRIYLVTPPTSDTYLAQEIKLLQTTDFLPEQHINSTVYAFQRDEQSALHPRLVPLVGIIRRSLKATEAFLVQGPIDPRSTLRFRVEGKACNLGLNPNQALDIIQELISALQDIERWLHPDANSEADAYAPSAPHPSRFQLRLHPNNILVEPLGRVRFLSSLVFPLHLSHGGDLYARFTLFDAPECEKLAQPHFRPRMTSQVQGEGFINPVVPRSMGIPQYIYSVGMVAIYLMLGSVRFGTKVDADIHAMRGSGTTQLIRSALELQSKELSDIIYETLCESPEKRPSIATICRVLHQIRMLSNMPVERLLNLSMDEFSAYLSEIHMGRLAEILVRESITPIFFIQMTEDDLVEDPFHLSPSEIDVIRPYLISPGDIVSYIERAESLKGSHSNFRTTHTFSREQRTNDGLITSLLQFGILTYQETPNLDEEMPEDIDSADDLDADLDESDFSGSTQKSS